MKFLVPLEVSLISSKDVSRRKFVNSLEQLIAHSAYAATIMVGSDPFMFYLPQNKAPIHTLPTSKARQI